MLARLKLLALAAIGVVTILWLGPGNDSGETNSTSELAMNADLNGAPATSNLNRNQPSRW
jgi:hypothetical protein